MTELQRQIAELQSSIKSLESDFKAKKDDLAALESKVFPDPSESLTVIEIVEALEVKKAAVSENRAAIAALRPEIESLGKNLADAKSLLLRRQALREQANEFFTQAKRLKAALDSARTEYAKLISMSEELSKGGDYYQIMGRTPLEKAIEVRHIPQIIIRPEAGMARVMEGHDYFLNWQRFDQKEAA